MAYQYTMTEQGDFLRVEVSGKREAERTVSDTIAFWQAILNESNANNRNNILAIFRVTGKRSLMETFDIVEALQGLIRDDIKIAYVETIPENRAETSIIGTTARMHGIAFQAFDNEAEASEWLTIQ
ncbi:hypothetical protein [Amphritea sp. HPY]|uniref:hypothetical protein n=1 Tax=Amphritea sp. HPY TaxID=3421652 RepID=UPI003D7DCC02